MKKLGFLFVLLATVFTVTLVSCVSTGSNSTDRAAMERAEKAARQVQIGNFYLSKFTEFVDLRLSQMADSKTVDTKAIPYYPPLPPDPTQGNWSSANDNAEFPYPLINAFGPSTISGGGSRWSPSIIQVTNNTLSEENIDQAIAA